MQAPKLPSIFKHRGARAFDYKPLYYDERKERLEEIKAKYATKDKLQAEELIRKRMKEQWRGERSAQVGRSNFTLMLIIGILLTLAYLLIYS